MNRIVLDDRRDYLDWRMGSGGTVEIFDVVVNSARRKGRGKALVHHLFSLVPPGTRLVWAITRADNQIAQHWYEALRFKVVGVLRNFYADANCVDAIMYGRDLHSQA